MMPNTPVFKDFLEKEAQLAEKIAKSISNDPYVLASYKNWPRLNQADRLDFALYFARSVAYQMGRYNPMVDTFNKPKDSQNMIVCGRFKRNGEHGPTLLVNTNEDALRDFQIFSDTIVHEETHDRQLQIEQGRIGGVDPSIVNKIKYENTNYISTGEGYAKQFIEIHAQNTADRLMKTLLPTLKQKQHCVLNSEEGERIQKEYETRHTVLIANRHAVDEVDPRKYYLLAKSKSDKLKYNNSPMAFYELVTNYELAMRYGEYTHGFSPSNPARELYNIANGAMEESPCEVPEIYRKMARAALEKYKDSPRPDCGVTVRNCLKMLDRNAQYAEARRPGQPRPNANAAQHAYGS